MESPERKDHDLKSKGNESYDCDEFSLDHCRKIHFLSGI